MPVLMKMLTGLTLALLFQGATVAWAAIDAFEFAGEENREQYQTLTEELRCPKCQNQNLADSNSPIASDMRREIHRMVEEGKSSQEVVDFMVARYGDFVRYRPKRDATTAVLWYGPVVALVFGVLVVVMIARKRRPTKGQSASDLADKEQQRLKDLLDEDSKDNHK